jgi:hypothetical protein
MAVRIVRFGSIVLKKPLIFCAYLVVERLWADIGVLRTRLR